MKKFNCMDCNHLSRNSYSLDGFDVVFRWRCEKEDKEIHDCVDWNEERKMKTPEWCPIIKELQDTVPELRTKEEKVVEPIKPEDVSELKKERMPDGVIECFNELIADNLHGGSARFTQDKAVNALMRKLCLSEDKRNVIFENHYLDVEDIFRKAGWKVEFDKPAYCESYESNYTFSKK